ncbi:DEAD/DEAH box helicase family protein [Seonamhaeicola marinus]|uniref:Helicase ATP-binding domain-containing protein n=1 Tax=Seonamhaeicola marinus TaxID=1912246 RepID=A0A5D0I4B1_9FLAO|nr:DEAD/DEAH box helicase family protein [Seonamhaeicola marinus]TYA78545.1 hypothetical protein FUA24_09320 [Seonamhaeicola marinus]
MKDTKKRFQKQPSALSLYNKWENHQIQLKDLERQDMHFSLKTGADILIEENSIHIDNPFKLDVKDLYEWSLSEQENFELVLERYLFHYKEIRNKYSIESKDYLDQRNINDKKGSDELLKSLKQKIDNLRIAGDTFEAVSEIMECRSNIFKILYTQNQEDLENPMLKLYLDDLSLTNKVTILQSSREREGKQDASSEKDRKPYYEHQNRDYSLGEVIEILQNPNTNLNEKNKRPLLLPNTTGNRIIGEESYLYWSGLQVFDVDLKNCKSYLDDYADGSQIRDILFKKLKHYPWLIGITLSSSKQGLHVYTKVSRMHHLFKEEEANMRNQKYWFRMSYIQKHAAIAYILDKYTQVDVYNKKGHNKGKIIDRAMATLTQGIYINHDGDAKWSRNFIDLYPVIFYHLPPDNEAEPEDWILNPKILEQYQSWFYENSREDTENINFERTSSEMKLIVDESLNLKDVSEIDMNTLDKGQKYNTRWRVCNTIMHAFGDTDIARNLCHHILQTAKTNTKSTIDSYIRSALVNNKEADFYTVNMLKEIGVRISFDEESRKELVKNVISELKFTLNNSNYDFNLPLSNHNIQLGDKEFLGMRMHEILGCLREYKINIIESAPNTGKTELFKYLAKNKAVCLVMPFISTIESKISTDEKMNEIFEIYCGSKSINDIKKGKSVILTFDKFSQLPKSKYKIFDYIVVDESHLLFTSTYRLQVVSRILENIRTYLLDDLSVERKGLASVLSVNSLMSFLDKNIMESKTNIILMSGTLTAEVHYFGFYKILNYIKVLKNHPYEKNVKFILSKTNKTKNIGIFIEIANTIKNGGKVIHPTNKGESYVGVAAACVESILGRKVNFKYYKKANQDDTVVQDINSKATTSDIDLLFCTDYLSVGIDIKDTDDFTVIFSNDFTAEAIEQFNNRLRNTDINCRVYFDLFDDEECVKPNIVNRDNIEYSYNDEMKNLIKDGRIIAKLGNAIKSRKSYNAILGDLISKYYVTDSRGNIQYVKSAFEIEQFEQQYKRIAKSLFYIKTVMEKNYNYQIDFEFVDEYSGEIINGFEEIMADKKREFRLNKSISFIKSVEFYSDNEVYRVLREENLLFQEQQEPIVSNGEISEFYLGYNNREDRAQFIIYYHKKHKLVKDWAIDFTLKMRKLYSKETVLKIIDHYKRKNGLINQAELVRYQELTKLVTNNNDYGISLHSRTLFEIMYKYVSPYENTVIIDYMEYIKMVKEMESFINLAIEELGEGEVSSNKRKEEIYNLNRKFLDMVFNKRFIKDNVKIGYRKLFEFDNSEVIKKMEKDAIFERIIIGNDVDKKEPQFPFSLS